MTFALADVTFFLYLCIRLQKILRMKKIVTLFAGIFCALCLHATPTEVSVQRIQLLPIGADCIGYGLYDDTSDKAFIFPIYVSDGATDVELGRTYTIDDMNRVYTYWMLSDYSTHALFTAATFKKTEDANGKVRIDATATDTNNDEWILTYDEAALSDAVPQTTVTPITIKRIVNGQLVIEKDGTQYNPLGTVVR